MSDITVPRPLFRLYGNKETKLNVTPTTSASNPTSIPSSIPASIQHLPVDQELCKYISKATKLTQDQGWEGAVKAVHTPPNLSPSIKNIPHLVNRYLNYLRKYGAPMKM